MPADPAPLPIDVEALLAPCAGDDPCGEDLRYDDVKGELKNLVAKDGVDEDGVPQTRLRYQPGHARWKAVLDGSVGLLEKSKDLESMGLLAEALMELHGPAGLTAAYDLAGGLCERYWEGVYPRIDDGEPDFDLEARATRLSALTSEDAPNLPGRLKTRPPAEPPPTLPPADQPDFYRARLAEIGACRDAAGRFVAAARAAFERSFEKYDDALPRSLRLDELAPVTKDVDDALDEQAEALEKVFAARFPGRPLADDAAPADGPETPAAAPSAAAAPAVGGPAGPPRTRAEAVERLRQAVGYFRDAEPHSPVGPLVDRAVRWSAMPLADVFRELVEDDDVLDRIRKTLGVAPPPDEDEDD